MKFETDLSESQVIENLITLQTRCYTTLWNTRISVNFLPRDSLCACIARYCYRKSLDRPSLMLMYRSHISWVCSKVIIRLISLGSSLLEAPIHWHSSPRGASPKFGWNRVGVAVLSRKPAISLKRGYIGPRLLLMTNRKLHKRFRLVPKWMTLDDLERPLCTLLQNMRLSEPTTKGGVYFDYISR